MRISIFGLGYVGCVCAAGFARLGHSVIGVDSLRDKVDQLSRGLATVIEPDLAALVREGYEQRLISATMNVRDAVMSTEIGIICVGTPSSGNGHLDLSHVHAVASELGAALRDKEDFFTVVIRSTVVPGTNERISAVLAEVSGKQAGVGFGTVSNPEFLREGSAIEDFLNPQVTVVGTSCERSARDVERLYAGITANVRRVDVRVAEIIKYVNNAFHALKVTFANEVGSICKKTGIDARSVMELFCEDKRLNISPAYLMPGPAYGGSCLPKDLRGLVALAHDGYVDTPLISTIERSNSVYKELLLESVLLTGKTRVGFVGLSFKQDTDDLRSSPAVELAERLIGKGLWILIYDRNVRMAKLVGANRAEIDRRIPKIQSYLTESLTDLVERTEVLVISQKEDGLMNQISRYPEKIFIDLVRLDPCLRTGSNYVGIAW